MSPLGVIRTGVGHKQKSIFEKLNPFIEKLVGTYKKSQETKWENEWISVFKNDIEKAGTEQEVESALSKSTIPEENLDLERFKTEFAPQAIGMLKGYDLGKYTQPGTKPIPGVTEMPQPTVAENLGIEKEPKSETDQITAEQAKGLPDGKEWKDTLKFVQELDTGKVDYKDTLAVFQKRLDSGRALGAAAKQTLMSILGQSMPVNKREKMEEDVGFTSELHQALYEEEEAPSSPFKLWQRDNPDGTFEDYRRDIKGEDKSLDIDTFIKGIGKDLEVSNVNVSGDGTVNSFSLKPKDTTTDVDIKATIAKAEEWVRDNPDTEIDDINFKTGSVSIGRKTKGGTDKLTPSGSAIESLNQALLSNPDEREGILKNYGLKHDFSNADILSEEEVLRRTYNRFEGIIREEEFIDDEGFVQIPEGYTDFYKDYERYAKKYFELTGEILKKKYLSLEEAGKYTGYTLGQKGYKGGQKPVLNAENIPWSWEGEIDSTQEFHNDMQRTNEQLIKEGKAPVTIADINLDKAGKLGINIKQLKELIGNQ